MQDFRVFLLFLDKLMIVMRNLTAHLLALGLLTLPIISFAQEEPEKKNTFNLDLQFVTQGEIRDGGLVSDNTDNPEQHDHTNFVVSRVRMNLGYQHRDLELKVIPQYTYIWGQQGYGSFRLYEAYAKYTAPFGLIAQLGRQALSYDDERIIGPNDWAMGSVSHDVLKLGYEGHGHKVHALLGYNQNPDNIDLGGTDYYNGAQPYKIMHTLWYHYDVPGINLGASVLFMNLGVQSAEELQEKRTIYQQMVGTHLSFTPKWGDFSACYYRQLGRNEYNIPLAGWMAAFKGHAQPTGFLGITAGYDYLSGDPYFVVPDGQAIGLIRHDVMRGFSSLYGSHHKFYGIMDFFYVSTYYHGFSPGLQNAFAGVDASFLNHTLSFSGTYHYLATSTKLKDLGMTLGHCVELSAAWQPLKYISLSLGYSFMSGTETMKRLKRASSDGRLNWAWLTVVIFPGIFNKKW